MKNKGMNLEELLERIPYRFEKGEDTYALQIFKNREDWTVEYFAAMACFMSIEDEYIYTNTCGTLNCALVKTIKELEREGIL